MGPNTTEAKQLLAFIERIERLEEDKKQVGEDIKEVYVKIMRMIVKIRSQDADTRREEQELLSLYMDALGMYADTPLVRSAIDRAVRGLGRPSEVTLGEQAKGVVAAFERDGTRATVSFPDQAAKGGRKKAPMPEAEMA